MVLQEAQGGGRKTDGRRKRSMDESLDALDPLKKKKSRSTAGMLMDADVCAGEDPLPVAPGSLDISQLEGAQLLSPEERRLCSELQLIPAHYFTIKERYTASWLPCN